MKRRTLIQAATSASLFPLLTQAQDKYPNPAKTIMWICPYAAGGNADSRSRQVAKAMGTILGQPIIIDNKAGAGGNLGVDFVAKSEADGYTIGLQTVSLAINPGLTPKMPTTP